MNRLNTKLTKQKTIPQGTIAKGTNNLVSLVDTLLSVDKSELNVLNATQMVGKNDEIIIY